MFTIRMDEEKAVEMLVDRVRFWTDDEEVIALFEQMYENQVDCGCFDGSDFDVMAIVDNDYINWTRIVCEGEDDYEEIKAHYDAEGCGDCSCELDCCDYIEAEYNGIFLVR